MPCESLDSGILVGQVSGDFSSEPVSEFSGKADRLGRTHSVTGEWFPDVYLARLDAKQVRELVDQPFFDDVSAAGIRENFPAPSTASLTRRW